MRRFKAFVVLAVLFGPMPSGAQDKKEPRSLVDEAAYLKEKSGENGWVSEEVTVSMNDGKIKNKGKLKLVFGQEKDKPSGGVSLRIAFTGGAQVASGAEHFELVEKDGTRRLQISQLKFSKENRFVPDPETTRTLEYSIAAGRLTVTGGVFRKWVGFDVDFTKGITFKEAGK
jgi:hypothetical protein